MSRAVTLVVAVISCLLVFTTLAAAQGNFDDTSLECNKSSTDPKINWCRYNNPFILSDFLSRNSTALTEMDDAVGNATIGSDDGSTKQEYKLSINCSISIDNDGKVILDGDGNPQHTCTAISQIRSGSIGIPESSAEMVKEHDGKLVQGQGGDHMSRFVIFTDLDGKMLFVHFNNNTMANSVRVDVPNVVQFDTAQTQHNELAIPASQGGATAGGELTLVVNRGSGLYNLGTITKSDPYVIVYNTSGSPALQTVKIDNTLNPVWPSQTSTIEMQFPSDTTTTSVLMLKVWDAGLTQDDFMGQVEVSIGTLAQDLGVDGGTKTYTLPLSRGTGSEASSLPVNVTDLGTIQVTATYVPTKVATTVQDLTLLICNSTSLALVSVAGLDPSNVTTCYLFTDRVWFHEHPGLQLLTKAEFFPKTVQFADPLALMSLLWVWHVPKLGPWVEANGGTAQPWMSHINYNMYMISAAPMQQKNVRTYIHTCPVGANVPAIYFHLYSPQPAKFEIFQNEASNMTFLFAYTTRSISMYRIDYSSPDFGNYTAGPQDVPLFDWCEDHEVINSTNQLNMMSRQRSTIYCAPNDGTEITAVGVFSPYNFENIGAFTGDIFLNVGLKNSSGSFGHVFDLQELIWVNQTNPNSTLTNPLDLPSTFGTSAYPCDFTTQFWNIFVERCDDRYVLDFEFDGSDPVSSVVSLALAGKQNGGNNGGNNSTENTTSTNSTNEQTNTTAPPVNPLANLPNGSLPHQADKFKAGGLPDFASWKPDTKIPMKQDSHILIFVSRGRRVDVFTMFPESQGPNTKPKLVLEFVNQVNFLGDVSYLHVSSNGQHLFTAITRQKWELDSQRRFLDICDSLKQNPADPFLEPFQSSCNSLPAQEVNLNSFTQYASVCSTIIYCPYLNQAAAQLPPDGYYAERPAVLKPCPMGSFCVSGQKQQCPPGFYCPTEGLTNPVRCPAAINFASTCSDYGQIAPKPCKDGTVCIVNHIPGLPAPPGYMVPKAPALRSQLLECPEGWWCNLGIQQPYNDTKTGKMTPYPESTLYCPANTFCLNTSVLQPDVCRCDDNKQIDLGNGTMEDCDGRTLYCPPKTTHVNWCEAGFYCTKPNISVPCVDTQYCPPGTFAPQLCPSSYYCPHPSEKIICPESHYCQRGSLAPSPCNLLTVCPVGSASQSRSFLAPVVLLLVVIGVLLGFFLFTKKIRRENEIAATVEVLSPEARRFLLSGGADEVAAQADDDDDGSGGSLYSEMKESSLESGKLKSSHIPVSRFETPNITFEGMGLELKVGDHKGKNVLDNVTGEIPPGSFVAVMGPSGSGKSTFMHTLAGKAFYGERLGRVLVNGEEVNLTEFSKVIGFVKQDDIMLREMTVGETLLFNAKMRYDPQSVDSPAAIAKSMLKVLDLTHVKDVNIGDEKKRGISGGQRKRVNIGMEMCSLPCILFLDEPTSGLDSSSSMTVCQALRDMADAGITVIAVIHQPRFEIFNMFHKVMLLAKGGKLVYYGDPQEAMPYFEEELELKCPPHINPPDFFMDSISGDVLQSAAGEKKEGEKEPMTVDRLQEMWNQSKRNYLPPILAKERAAGKTGAAPTESKPESGRDEGEQSLLANENEGGTTASVKNDSAIAEGVDPYQDMIGGAALAANAKKKEVAGFFSQLMMFTNRSMVQQSRDIIWFFTDLSLVLVAGFFLGLVFSKSEYRPPLPDQIINQSLSGFGNSPPPSLKEFFNRPVDDPIISEASLTCMAIGMTGVTAALRVFGGEQIVYWREASAGMSTPAYFLAKNITHILFIVLSPLLYLTPFLTFVSARAPLMVYYQVAVILQFSTTGLGYFISIVAPPGLDQLAGVVVVLVFSMFGGARPTLLEIKKMFPLLHPMPYLSYIRWGQEALYLNEIREWNKVEGVNVAASLDLFGYSFDDYEMCVWTCFGFGVLFRLMALIAMTVMNRHQKH